MGVWRAERPRLQEIQPTFTKLQVKTNISVCGQRARSGAALSGIRPVRKDASEARAHARTRNFIRDLKFLWLRKRSNQKRHEPEKKM